MSLYLLCLCLCVTAPTPVAVPTSNKIPGCVHSLQSWQIEYTMTHDKGITLQYTSFTDALLFDKNASVTCSSSQPEAGHNTTVALATNAVTRAHLPVKPTS